MVGGGEVAERKARQLLRFKGAITLIAPAATRYLQSAAEEGKIVWQRREYSSPEAEDYSLVIATTDDCKVNRQVFQDASAAGVMVNVVDEPELCTVYFPAIIERGKITIAIGSEGSAPFFTRSVKENLERMIPSSLAEEAALAEIFRDFVIGECAGEEEKKQVLYRKFLTEVEEHIQEWKAEDPPLNLWRQWLREND